MTTPYHPLREEEYPDNFPWNLPNPPPPVDPSDNWLDTPITLPDPLSTAHRRHDWNCKYRNQPRNPRERAGFRKTNHADLRRTGYRSLRDDPKGEDTDNEDPPQLIRRKRRERRASPPPPPGVYNGRPGRLVRGDQMQEVRRVEDQLPPPVELDVRNSAKVDSGRAIPDAARGVQRPPAVQPPPRTVAATVESSVAAQANGGSILVAPSSRPFPLAPSRPPYDFNQLGSRVSGPGAPEPSGSSHSAFAPLPQRSIPTGSDNPRVPGRPNGMHSPGMAVGFGAPASVPGGSVPGVPNGQRSVVVPNGQVPTTDLRGSSNLNPAAGSSHPGSLNGLYRPGHPNGLPPARPNSPVASNFPMPAFGSSIRNAPSVPHPPGQPHHQPPISNASGSSAPVRVAKPQQKLVREGK